MPEKTKPVLTPEACFDHDQENYYITVEMPGVEKKDIQVSASEQSFCVRGSREDADLLGCWYLGHPIEEDKAKAKYKNGMLYLIVPMRKPLKGKKITVE